MQDVTDKVAFVTGGASGMGLAMVRSFAAAGMKVVAADIQQDALDAVAKEFEGSNADVLTMRVDVTDRAAMEAAAQATEDHFGKVHVLCNNAGVAVFGSVDDMSYDDWDWVMNVNLQGVINGMQSFIKRIESHGEGGHVVNTASMAGQVAFGGLSVYNVTKFAVVGMSEATRMDLAPKNIGVSVLCPGVVATNIFNSERNRPDELAVSSVDTTAATVSLGAQSDAAEQSSLLGNVVDPAAVGEMVLDAVRNDDPYIFTHPEFKAAVEQRHSGLMNSFDRWSKYVEDAGTK